MIQPAEQSADPAKPIQHFISLMSSAGGDAKDLNHCGLAGEYKMSTGWSMSDARASLQMYQLNLYLMYLMYLMYVMYLRFIHVSCFR